MSSMLTMSTTSICSTDTPEPPDCARQPIEFMTAASVVPHLLLSAGYGCHPGILAFPDQLQLLRFAQSLDALQPDSGSISLSRTTWLQSTLRSLNYPYLQRPSLSGLRFASVARHFEPLRSLFQPSRRQPRPGTPLLSRRFARLYSPLG